MTGPRGWPVPAVLPPTRPSADDDPAWIWIVNLVLAALVLVAAAALLFVLASAGLSAFESEEPDGTAWVFVLGIVLAIVAVPVAIASLVVVICAALRNRAAFIVNIVVGTLTFGAGFGLLLVAAGVAGIVITTDRRRIERALAVRPVR